jgi:hypothetical protein
MTPTIRIATPREKLFILDLARKFSNQLGFIPAVALDWYLDNALITEVMENDTPAGYLLGRPSLRWNRAIRPITQAAVCFDAQRRHLGLALIAHAQVQALAAGQIAIQANCREGIDANEFWLAAGFQLICKLDPNNARGKAVNCWRKLLGTTRPAWFDLPPQYAGHRARKVVK